MHMEKIKWNGESLNLTIYSAYPRLLKQLLTFQRLHRIRHGCPDRL
jgi:hypothetical protein